MCILNPPVCHAVMVTLAKEAAVDATQLQASSLASLLECLDALSAIMGEHVQAAAVNAMQQGDSSRDL